jgi:hypothetical protein
MKIFKSIFCLLVFLFCAHLAQAVCLDPQTLVSGYKIPLKTEVASSGIVLGKVIKKLDLHEDKADPEDITATLYTIRVQQTLKGINKKTIQIKSQNDSGRYYMDIGEEHLLFLSGNDKYLYVDSCGNSSKLPEGNSTLKTVKEYLKKP